MATPIKTMVDNFTINGDISAHNIAKAGHTNDYNDLVVKPTLLDSNGIKLVSGSLTIKVGAKANGKHTSGSGSYDVTGWAYCDVAGYDAIGLAGFTVSGTGWNECNCYCATILKAGQKPQALDGPTLTKDGVNFQIQNFGTSTRTLTIRYTVLYKKV